MVLLPFHLLSTAQQQPPDLVTMLQTLQENPTNPHAHNNVGLGFKAKGDLPAAIRHFEQAISYDPGYARGYNNLGNALQASARAGGGAEQMAHAAEFHRWAVALQPTYAAGYNSLGNALRAMGDVEGAVRALNVAVDLSGTANHYSNLGAASLELHKTRKRQAAQDASSSASLQEAAAALEAALRWLKVAEGLNPADANVLNNLAAAYEADGQLGGARQLFETLLAHDPTNPLLTIHRANVLKGQGQLHEAVYAYTSALTINLDGDESALAYNNLGTSLQALGSSQLALEAYSSAIALDPTDQVARANLNKLPVGPPYKGMAAYETRVLAARAAAAAIAAHGARRAGAALPAAPPLSVRLYRTLRYLRRLETEQVAPPGGENGLWAPRAEDMALALEKEQSGAGSTRQQLTLGAFAWGGVWLHSFTAAFTHPEVRAAMGAAARGGGVAVVLGASLGFEAYLPALSYGVQTVGLELLCSLTSLAEHVREAHGVPSSLARFECGDALEWSLPAQTSIVYVDDTAWDTPSITKLAAKLAGELPKGAVVVHNSHAGYEASKKYKLLETVEVACSWNHRHPVLVHMRR
eukprot:Transcript_2385.p1 GENE.Transcript_2385~~Transcript_2385.p1  ORF type:complete len:619 (-),score=253.58 Transcript_2385:211-1959(-)